MSSSGVLLSPASGSIQSGALEVREDEYSRRVGYPAELVQAFRNANLSLWQLPSLDLKGRAGSIDYLGPQDVDSFPVLKFTDRLGRVGVVFRLRGKLDARIEIEGSEQSVRTITPIVSLFKRYTDRTSWRVGCAPLLEQIYRRVQESSPRVGSATEDSFLFLKQQYIQWGVSLIAQTDPVMVIDGEIPQIPLPLPPMPPESVVTEPLEPPAVDNPRLASLSRRVWNAVSRFFSWVASGVRSLISRLGEFLCLGRPSSPSSTLRPSERV
jgi:hypothetical protein